MACLPSGQVGNPGVDMKLHFARENTEFCYFFKEEEEKKEEDLKELFFSTWAIFRVEKKKIFLDQLESVNKGIITCQISW